MSSQDQIVGSKQHLRIHYILKVDEEIVFNGAGDLEVPVETIQNSEHSFYRWSVIGRDSASYDVWQTAGIVLGAIGGGVQTALLKRRNFVSTRDIDVILYISAALPCTLGVKVYRDAGLD